MGGGGTLGVSAAVDVRKKVQVKRRVLVSGVVGGGGVRAVVGSEVAKITKTVGVPKISSMVTDCGFLFAWSLIIMIIANRSRK